MKLMWCLAPAVGPLDPVSLKWKQDEFFSGAGYF